MFSVACRPIERGGLTVTPGHGGRWSDVADAPCPICGRRMVTTGSVVVADLERKREEAA